MNKRYKTVNINNFGITKVNKLLTTNCNAGWEFLGFGTTTENWTYGGEQTFHFASFRTDDPNLEFKEIDID